MATRFGAGQLRYELVEGWERLPAGWSHPDVAGVCTDADGNVYLYARGDHPVIVYDSNGKFLGSWGEGRFSYRTHGMHMGRDGLMYLVDDLGGSVGRYGLDGTLLQAFGPAGVTTDTGYSDDHRVVERAGAPYNRPTNVALAPSGDVYVSDGYGNCRVHHFTGDGDLLGSWGEPGGRQAEFRTPHSIWVHDDGRVFVCDRQNERIQIFDPAGNYLAEWTDVQRPQDIFMGDDGLVYVVELSWHRGEVAPRRGTIDAYIPGRLSILDGDGNVLVRWQEPDLEQPDAILAPHGVWVDDAGSIYIAHATNTVAVGLGLVGPDALTFQKFARV
jgi:DNA-binding beta-propeller fold protein YncE